MYELETYDGCSCVDTHPAYNADGQYTAPVLLFAFLIGLQCCEYRVRNVRGTSLMFSTFQHSRSPPRSRPVSPPCESSAVRSRFPSTYHPSTQLRRAGRRPASARHPRSCSVRGTCICVQGARCIWFVDRILLPSLAADCVDLPGCRSWRAASVAAFSFEVSVFLQSAGSAVL